MPGLWRARHVDRAVSRLRGLAAQRDGSAGVAGLRRDRGRARAPPGADRAPEGRGAGPGADRGGCLSAVRLLRRVGLRLPAGEPSPAAAAPATCSRTGPGARVEPCPGAEPAARPRGAAARRGRGDLPGRLVGRARCRWPRGCHDGVHGDRRRGCHRRRAPWAERDGRGGGHADRRAGAARCLRRAQRRPGRSGRDGRAGLLGRRAGPHRPGRGRLGGAAAPAVAAALRCRAGAAAGVAARRALVRRRRPPGSRRGDRADDPGGHRHRAGARLALAVTRIGRTLGRCRRRGCRVDRGGRGGCRRGVRRGRLARAGHRLAAGACRSSRRDGHRDRLRPRDVDRTRSAGCPPGRGRAGRRGRSVGTGHRARGSRLGAP